MDNPGYSHDDGGDSKHKIDPVEAKVLDEIHNKADPLEAMVLAEIHNESDVPEAYRYSAEKKALEAIDEVISMDIPATKPYAGMGKEDLLRFSQTPFWNRFRMFCTIFFWLVWLALLVAVIVLTVTFPQCKPAPEKQWHETSIIYQIYVRSFYDFDGDGIGDINGIRSKLDYLSSIDTGAILLSSVYKSHPDADDGGSGPADYGYEVTDHKDIDPTFGDMADMEALLQEAHDLGIRVIMDFIPNYTGSDHEWFTNSNFNNSHSNPWWNYYIWADCAGAPPNNWRTVYSQIPWTSGAAPGRPGECYLHQFLDTQPELNLRSASVKQELESILRFWLDRGVDGFRVVNTKYLFEDADLRSESLLNGCTDVENYDCYNHTYTTSQDEVYPLIAEWRMVLDEYTDENGVQRILMTDAMDTVDNTMMYYGKYGPDGSQLPINYVMTQLNTSCNARCVYDVIDSGLYSVPMYGTANWMTGTQDISRLADVIPQEDWDNWSYQNSITMLKMTLPGAALMYYGEEIGMPSVNSTMTEDRDPAGVFGLEYSRDPYRSPMQWNNGTDGGFVNETGTNTSITIQPWLPLGDNLFNISIEAQNETEYTPFQFYSELAALRTSSETFGVGNLHYTLLTDDILSYYREYEGMDRYLIAINFGSGSDPVNIATSHYDVPNEAEVVMTTRGGMSVVKGDMAKLKELQLDPGDGVMVTWEYVRPDK